jgi:dipeptidyl aminopeptidase/acylaminoacyl peptidase
VIRRAVALLALLLAPGLPLAAPTAGAQSASGELLAVVGRQVARVNLTLSRPSVLTAVPLPANAVDVAYAGGTTAAVAVTGPLDSGVHAGELFSLDLASGALSPLVERATPTESLTAPAWWPDGSGVLFQREDVEGPLVPSPVHEIAHYPSRIESVAADGTGRFVLAYDARYPGPSPDGATVTFVREGPQGAALMAWSAAGEAELIPVGRFVDIAYPRYNPAGDRIAFLAIESSSSGEARFDPLALLRPAVAEAHGWPWSLWLVAPDGSSAQKLADPQADEASIAWSPDGTRLFVYSNSGSYLVDVGTGVLTALPRWVGSGTVAWVTD